MARLNHSATEASSIAKSYAGSKIPVAQEGAGRIGIVLTGCGARRGFVKFYV